MGQIDLTILAKLVYLNVGTPNNDRGNSVNTKECIILRKFKKKLSKSIHCQFLGPVIDIILVAYRFLTLTS